MATYYWIGGTGNWGNTSKWSLTSNGAAASVVPGAADDVIFDANSDGAASANFTVTANVSGCAANSITVTTDRVITFDGGSGNLSANFWTQNASASTTGAILNNTISINSNVTVNRGVFTANGNLTIGNNFFANGFGTPATANRVVFTLANTMTTGTFTANASNWFWQNFNFSANSRLYLTGRNTAIFAVQSPNIAMTWGTNTAIIANGAGVPGETRNVVFIFASTVTNNGSNANANLTPFSFNVTNGSDTVNFNADAGYFGGIDFTGFSGTANIQNNLWCANGNLLLSPTMTLTSASSARSIRIGGWTGSNTGLITNGLSNASVGINFQGANINANMFVANNFDLLGNSLLGINGGNVNLGNNIISAAQLSIGASNHGINFNTSGEIILTGNNQTVFTGTTSAVNAQNYQGNIKITSNYTGATGTRTFITTWSNLTIKVSGSNGIFIGNTATDNISILSNASNSFGSSAGSARFDLRGMTNTLLNNKRAVKGGSFFPTTDKMQAGSNVTALTDGVLDSQGIIFPFPIQLNHGGPAVTISGNNIESTSSILLGSGGATISNVKVIGTNFSSNNTIDVSSKSLTFSGSEAEILVTGNNTTIIDISGNTTSFWNTGLTGFARIRSTYTGSTGTRNIILGNQAFSSNLSNSVASFTLGFSNVSRGIDLNSTATDTVLVTGDIFNLDLTGMNCSWNQGVMNVYGNFTSESTTGTILESANLLFITGSSASSNTLVSTSITGTAGEFSCNNNGNLSVGMSVVVSGTLTGTGTITGYTSPKTYYIIALSQPTTGFSSLFQLSATLGGSPITTTAGSTTGLTFTIQPKRQIDGKNRQHNFNITGPNGSGGGNALYIVSNLVLASNRTYTQSEGALVIESNMKLSTGILTLATTSDTFSWWTEWKANSSIEITGSNTTVYSANRFGQYNVIGTPNVYFSYSGSVGNRLINVGGSGLTSGGTNALCNTYNFGTNSSSQYWFNPVATDTIVFINNCNINDLSMSQWTGNLSLGNGGAGMLVRGNLSLPITGNIVNTPNINMAIPFSGVQRTLSLNNTSPNCNINLTALSFSVMGNYLISGNLIMPSDKSLIWTGGNLTFTQNSTIVTNTFNNQSATAGQRSWNTGNANITITGNSGTIVNIGNLQAVTGNIRILANNTNTGTRTFFGYTSNAGNLTPTYDFLVGTDFVDNAIVFTTSSNATTFNLGGRWRNVDLSNLYATQNNIMTVGYDVYGNYTLPTSNGTFTAGTGVLSFVGQSTTQYLNFNNRTWEVPTTFNGPSTTFIVNGNFTIGAANAAKTLTLSNGTLDLNGAQITTGLFLTGTGTKSILWDGGKIAVSNSSVTAWNANVPANFTTQVGTGAGRISMIGTAAKTFVGGNINYNATLDLAGAGNLTITGNNTFKDIVMTYTAANNFIIFPASGNTTVESFTGSGINNTVRLGLVSSTAGTRSNIHLTGNGVTNGNWANISDINFTPLVTNGTSPMAWYVGANSLNSSNVSGALFANSGANAPIVYAIESGTAWTVPNNWNSSNNIIYLYGAGGGGAGGRPTSATNKAAGAGGGGGGFTAIANFSASPGSTIAYEVGLGGAGGAANANGTAGGNTVWATVYTANGGGGGATTATPTSVPGVGGTGANANGGNGGFGTFSTVSGNGMGAGGGGGAGGPNGVGGAGGNGFASTTAANTAGGGGGGSGGGSGGVNATVTAAGTGGNNAAGFGGGAAGVVGRQGGGGGGGRNTAAAGKGGPGVDLLNSIGGGGGSGATANLAGSNNDVIRTYGGGGAGGGVTTATTGFAGGSGANGAVIVVYYVGEVPVGSGFQNMFLVF